MKKSHYTPSNRKKDSWISRNWFELFLLGLMIQVLISKDISIVFDMNSAGALAAASGFTLRPEEAGASRPALRPARLHSPRSTEVDPRGADENPESVGSDRYRNLTFILSPDYARRKGVAPVIVETKIRNCRDYVEQYAAVARAEMKQYGIPASITLAQGLLESDAGDSRLARESNNHFGIKCRRKCRGCTCRNYSDDDIYDMFRVFNSPWESFREHSELLNSGRYRHLLQLDRADYRGWAHGLKKAGYATDRRYAEKLIRIIEELDLTRYDR